MITNDVTKNITIPIEEYKKMIKSEVLADTIRYLLGTDTYLGPTELKKIFGVKEEEIKNESL